MKKRVYECTGTIVSVEDAVKTLMELPQGYAFSPNSPMVNGARYTFLVDHLKKRVVLGEEHHLKNVQRAQESLLSRTGSSLLIEVPDEELHTFYQENPLYSLIGLEDPNHTGTPTRVFQGLFSSFDNAVRIGEGMVKAQDIVDFEIQIPLIDKPGVTL